MLFQELHSDHDVGESISLHSHSRRIVLNQSKNAFELITGDRALSRAMLLWLECRSYLWRYFFSLHLVNLSLMLPKHFFEKCNVLLHIFYDRIPIRVLSFKVFHALWQFSNFLCNNQLHFFLCGRVLIEVYDRISVVIWSSNPIHESFNEHHLL